MTHKVINRISARARRAINEEKCIEKQSGIRTINFPMTHKKPFKMRR